MSEYSEDLLSGLTDEEREALKDPDDTTSTMGGQTAATEGDDDSAAADAGKDTAEEPTPAAGDDATPEQDQQQEQANSGDEEPADQQEYKPQPLLIAEVPADADAKLADIATRKGALVDQFDNGDITAKEYQTALDGLNKEERQLERAIDKAHTAAEMREQQERNAWDQQVRDFTSTQHPEYAKSRARWEALNIYVKEVAGENPNLNGPQILAKAHQKVLDDIGAVPGEKPAAKSKEDGKPLKGAKAEPPKTLAKVPAADNADIEDSRFSALDRLFDSDPEAAEEKLMKLSETDRDAYLARG